MSEHHDGSRRPTTAEPVRSGTQPVALGRSLRGGSRDLGLVEEVLEVGDHDFYLVDTRHWTYGSKRLVPCESIDVGPAESAVLTDVDEGTIRTAPDFDPFQLRRRRFRDDLYRHYDLAT